MENKDHIKEIIAYLKDDRPAHANVSMKRYMKHLGYTEDEIVKEKITNIQILLYEKYTKINELQQQLDKQEKLIQEIINARKYSKIIYYVGLLVGIIFILVGFLSNIFVSTISGFGLSIVSIVGLYEARINKW